MDTVGKTIAEWGAKSRMELRESVICLLMNAITYWLKKQGQGECHKEAGCNHVITLFFLTAHALIKMSLNLSALLKYDFKQQIRQTCLALVHFLYKNVCQLPLVSCDSARVKQHKVRSVRICKMLMIFLTIIPRERGTQLHYWLSQVQTLHTSHTLKKPWLGGNYR